MQVNRILFEFAHFSREKKDNEEEIYYPGGEGGAFWSKSGVPFWSIFLYTKYVMKSMLTLQGYRNIGRHLFI